MQSFPKRPLALCLSAALWLLVTGCSGLEVEAMAADLAPVARSHSGVVAVSLERGSASLTPQGGSVDPDALEQAILLSLQRAGLFEAVDTPRSADYVLGAELLLADSHPGYTLSAWVHLGWALHSATSGELLWSLETRGQGEASVDEGLRTGAREEIALERAVRANLNEVVGALSRLRL